VNREIKFRAWDKEAKKMIRSPYDCNFNIVILLPNLIQVHERSKEEKFIEGDYLGERFILMQFTGLHDKNGKEIYEGDVVKYTRKHWHSLGHPQHEKDLEDICLVYWDEERHSFGNDMRRKDGSVYSSGYLSFQDDRADKNIVEILGNIHENPELLNQDEK